MRVLTPRRALPIALLVVSAIATGLVVGFALTGDDGDRAARDAARGQTRGGGRAQGSAAADGARQSGGSTSVSEAARLNDEAFRLMGVGRYDQAIPLLERAVRAFPENSTGLTYAYALYNLGRSLRLAGRAQEAIPLLERRLRIENQRDTVARELRAARRDAGVDE
jgi:tetratricopeptide (TPR) repeat protein